MPPRNEGSRVTAESTRLIRTKPYSLIGVILRQSDYAGFNETTIKNAERILQKNKLKNVRRKSLLAPISEVPEEKDPIRLIEEFEAAEDFELCVRKHKPESYVFDGRRIMESPLGRPESFKFIKDKKPKVSRDTSNDEFVFCESIQQTDGEPEKSVPEMIIEESIQDSPFEKSAPEMTIEASIQDSPFEQSICEMTVEDDPFEQLLKICQQEDAILFNKLLNFKGCTKIGEGTFGEVFKAKVKDQDVALKIIPFTIEQEVKAINNDFMKSASAILPEAIISQKLSLLAQRSFENTNGFANVVQLSVVKGNYPKELIKAWKEYKNDVKNKKDALNDSPLEYSNKNQYYMAIALENGGKDLDTFKLKNEKEAISILIQVILSLRIAEDKLEFEHRDLHIGNILVRRFDDDSIIKFKLSEFDEKCVHSYGVISTIIDFTNSRISQDGMTIFVDLSTDNELFEGPTNDYQFQIYRDMKTLNNNEWSAYNPKTNCLWIHYLARKILEIKGIRLKRRKELQGTFDLILGCDNLSEFMELQDVKNIFKPHYSNASEEDSE